LIARIVAYVSRQEREPSAIIENYSSLDGGDERGIDCFRDAVACATKAERVRDAANSLIAVKLCNG
jgi:hypothetical protein